MPAVIEPPLGRIVEAFRELEQWWAARARSRAGAPTVRPG
jgi:hypothetical protein